MFTPASESFTAGLMYICGVAAFPIEVFEGPGTAHLRGDPAGAFLLSEYLAADEWWMVDRTPTRAEFVGLRSDGQYEIAIADLDANGNWATNNFGSCTPYSALQGLGAVDRVTWWIRKADWPQPSDTHLRVRARDFCPQTLGDRLHEPTIRYGDEKILMILSAEETDSYCGDGANQVTSLTIDLSQPVGDRSLWDGSTWPGRDAHVPTEPRGVCCG